VSASTRVDLGPGDDAARLAAVGRYEILDGPADGTFDDIVELAATACGAPIATVTIVDADRVWFAASRGLSGVTQVGTEPGLCASAYLADGPYVINDALVDPRTLDHPLVRGELGLPATAGCRTQPPASSAASDPGACARPR
jgi:GAF domain-containing protein